jgi:hypothetical protein
VDNGPNRLSRHENRALYELPLMKNIKNMLTRGGVFALWSAHRCNTFHARFDDAFDVTDVVTIPDWDRSGNPTDYFIYRGRSG